MPGPAPKPTRLRLLQGNPSKRPLNKREPRPADRAPTRPGWLLPEAKREWSRMVPALLRLGLLSEVDRAALASYCQWWARWVQAEKILTEQGLTFETPNGYVQQRPEVAISHKAAGMVKAYLQKFGLSPSDRSRLSVDKPQEADPFAEFLKQSGQLKTKAAGE